MHLFSADNIMKKLVQESEKLKKQGYIIKLTYMKAFDQENVYFIDICEENQNLGVEFVIFNGEKDKIKIHTALFREQLAKFMQNFPKDIAPTIGKLLDETPPKASDTIINSVYLNKNNNVIKY